MYKQPMKIDFVFTGSLKFTSDKNITRVFAKFAKQKSIEQASMRVKLCLKDVQATAAGLEKALK